MGNAAKVGDIGTDHDGFPPTKIISGSSDVFIDGLPVARHRGPLNLITNPITHHIPGLSPRALQPSLLMVSHSRSQGRGFLVVM
jgi:hypothetical protein